jgi:hypothetical protein
VKQQPDFRKIRLTPWAEDFIYAGSSAALLAVVNLYPGYWYFAFLTLIPLMFRLARASVAGAARLGFLFGLAFFGTMGIDALLLSFPSAVVRILLGVAVATALGAATGCIRFRFGLNPVFIAFLWAAAEYILMRLGLVKSLFGEVETSLPTLNALSTLFGLVVVSFLIVLANWILLLAIEKVISISVKNIKFALARASKSWDFRLQWRMPGDQFYRVPDIRGPPTAVSI